MFKNYCLIVADMSRTNKSTIKTNKINEKSYNSHLRTLRVGLLDYISNLIVSQLIQHLQYQHKIANNEIGEDSP